MLFDTMLLLLLHLLNHILTVSSCSVWYFTKFFTRSGKISELPFTRQFTCIFIQKRLPVYWSLCARHSQHCACSTLLFLAVTDGSQSSCLSLRKARGQAAHSSFRQTAFVSCFSLTFVELILLKRLVAESAVCKMMQEKVLFC